MSSLLRSSKFVRYFIAAARNVVVSSSRNPTDNIQSQNFYTVTQKFARNLATQAQNTRPQDNSNLERSLQQLDQDVRRIGRITRKEIEEVLEEIRNSKTATSSQSLLVIRCCGNLVPEELPQVRTKLVQEIWSTLENLQVPMDISHYNALLRVYLENEHDFSPAEILQKLERKGIEPNRVTFQRLITRYCQTGDIEGATKILEFMREKSLPVNESVFNALIMGHCQAMDLESAASILNVMRQAGLEPSGDTYTTLLVGYAKTGNIDKIRAILNECNNKDIYLLDKDYLEIVYALAISGHNTHVDEILTKARRSSGYNQDAINFILRLINRGEDEVAMKIFKTMAKPHREGNGPVNSGTFLIRQMVKAGRPANKVIDVCKMFETEGIHSKPLLVAVETSLSLGQVDNSLELLRALKGKGLPVRQHYFWPLICVAGKAKNDQLVAEILNKMTVDFELSPTSETIREYVLSNLTFSDSDYIVGYLKKHAGVSVGTAAVALVYELLQEGALAKASDTASKYRAFYSPALFRRPLILSYLQTKDTESFLNLLHHIHENMDRSVSAEEQDGSNESKADVVGNLIVDLLWFTRNDQSFSIKPILEGLLERGLRVSPENAEAIQSKLSGERLTNELSVLLTKLTSQELNPQPAVRKPVPDVGFLDTSASSLERLRKRITKAEEVGGQDVTMYKRILLGELCKSGKLDEAEAVFKELESEMPGVYAQLIDAFITAENIDKALEYMNKMVAVHPGSGLDNLKLARIVELLVKVERLDEAYAALDLPKPEQKFTELPFTARMAFFRALNTLAEKGDAENVEKLWNKLISGNHVEINNVIMGPLIKVQIVREDIRAALDKFAEICTKYKMTPWKSELTRKLIENEDAASLQKLTDLSTIVHGEINSLYDLVFAFVECGRIRQARKILETPGLRDRPQKLSTICERYQQEGSVQSLEGLAEATKDISHIDRSQIFNQLLKVHIRSEDVEKALALWTQMQEEDVQPSDAFLTELADFLESKGSKVPFVKPVATQHELKIAGAKVEPVKQTGVGESIAFKNAVRLGKIDEAFKIKQDLDKRQVKIGAADKSIFIEGLCRENRLGEAFNIAVEMLQAGQKITEKHLRFLVIRLSVSGCYEQLEKLGTIIDGNVKRSISYDNRLCGAYITAGKASDYLDRLLNEISHAKPEEISHLEDKFPKGAIVGIIDTNPELLPKLHQLAMKYHQAGAFVPMNALWTAYFIQPEMESKADAIWDQYNLASCPRLMFQRIITHAKSHDDQQLVERLIDKLEQSQINQQARCVAYSALIDVLVGKNEATEALNRLEAFLKKAPLESFYTSSLQRLKLALEKQGKSFPYTIPSRNVAKNQVTNSSDSGSSSDEEKQVKRAQ